MTTFLQLHLLVSYPPSNLNRDDIGKPKSAIFGGQPRLRISSQALKRSWRTSPFFEELRDGHMGHRTRKLGEEVFLRLREGGMEEDKAEEHSADIAKKFAKLRKKKEGTLNHLHTEQLLHITPSELRVVEDLVALLLEQGELGKDSLDALLHAESRASDVAMFGRMLAEHPGRNVEAAVQVAHALTTHPVFIEEDYFSAVDDWGQPKRSEHDPIRSKNPDNAGAGHIGEASFGAGIFYLYVNVNEDLLVANLAGDLSLATKTLDALVRSCVQVGPSGKANSYGSRCYAHYALAERGDQVPRQLSLAFLDGKREPGEATAALRETRQKMDRAYGAWGSEGAYEVDVLKGEGSIEELVKFATTGVAHA